MKWSGECATSANRHADLQIKQVLVTHGAKFLNYLTDSATHLIADNPEHANVSEAVDIYEKPVVTVSWIH